MALIHVKCATEREMFCNVMARDFRKGSLTSVLRVADGNMCALLKRNKGHYIL